MADAPAVDGVKQQYERWPYPAPIVDLDAWCTGNWEWFDPSHAEPLLWPEGREGGELQILIAGCGTNQAAVFARNNPRAAVLGIDVSQASLAHQQELKERYQLNNLSLRQLPIEQANQLGQRFDLIVSTGVLHHLRDPDAGLQALAACLQPRGCIGLMLYARYGRIGVELLQQITQELGLQADEEGLAVLQACLQQISPWHPLHSYVAVSPDLASEAGVIDTFLPSRERSYTVHDCLELLRGAGLKFQDWLFRNPYQLETGASQGDPFLERLRALPPRQQWAIAERLKTQNACHFFMGCPAEREHRAMDLGQPEARSLVPSLRLPYAMREGSLVAYGEAVDLGAEATALIHHIDGQRTVGELCEGRDPAGTLQLIKHLQLLDVIALARPAQR